MRLLASLLLTVGATVSGAIEGRAQSSWTITPYLGTYVPDEEATTFSPFVDPSFTIDVENGFVTGLRLERRLTDHWSAEATYAFTRYGTEVTLVVPLPPAAPLPVDDDASLPPGTVIERHQAGHHLVGAIRFTALSERPIRPYLIAGLGVSRRTLSFPFPGGVGDLDDLRAEGSEAGFVLQLGGGAVWWIRPGLGLRTDVRDHIYSCEAFSEPCVRDVTLHEIEMSIGIAITPR